MHKTLSDNDTLLFQNIEALSSRLTRLMSLHEDALAIVAQHADQQDQRHLYRLLIQRFKLENEVLTCFRRMELLTEGLLFNDDINSAHISNAVEHEQRSNRKFIDRMEAMLKKMERRCQNDRNINCYSNALRVSNLTYLIILTMMK